MTDITEIERMFIACRNEVGQEILVEIVPMENVIPQISIDVDASKTYDTGRDPNDVHNWGRFINLPKRTISINTEFKEMYVTTLQKAIDQDELFQLLFEEAS